MEIKRVVNQAVAVLLSRGNDTSTVNGHFATVDIDELILLEQVIIEAFDLPTGDVRNEDVETISLQLDTRTPSPDKLREALKNLTLMARTSGGTTGPDRKLMEACEKAEAILQALSTEPEYIEFDTGERIKLLPDSAEPAANTEQLLAEAVDALEKIRNVETVWDISEFRAPVAAIRDLADTTILAIEERE